MLNLNGIDPYRVRTEHVKPYRDHVTVEELDDQGRPIRSWTEPFDATGKGDRAELEGRFQRRIDTGHPPADRIEHAPVNPAPEQVLSAVAEKSMELVSETAGTIGHIAYTVADHAVTLAAERMEAAISQAVEAALEAHRWRNRIRRAFRRKHG